MTTHSVLPPKPKRVHPAVIFRSIAAAPLTAKLGIIIVAVYIILAVFAGQISPYGEAEIVSDLSFAPWSSKFILGTDQLGRDTLSRLIYGARNTVGLALFITVISFILGSILGMLAAIFGGWVDQILSRIIDVMMSIPTIISALILLSIFGTGLLNLLVILALLISTRVFRLSRAVSLGIVVTDFFEIARLRGEGVLWMMRSEILPNVMPTLIAEFGMRFCFVFLIVSALSFLGIGIQPPLADWGSMVRETSPLISYGDITPLLPAGAIAILTVGVNFLVDWLLEKSSGLDDG